MGSRGDAVGARAWGGARGWRVGTSSRWVVGVVLSAEVGKGEETQRWHTPRRKQMVDHVSCHDRES